MKDITKMASVSNSPRSRFAISIREEKFEKLAPRGFFPPREEKFGKKLAPRGFLRPH
jgi:hypothetical protein